MQIGASDVISVLALAASVGSVVYAKQAVDAARASNKVNLHQPRAKIFQAIFDFRRLFIDLDLHPTDEEIQHFYVEAVLPAHVYLSGPLVGKMYEIYRRAAELHRQIEHEAEFGSSDRKWQLTNELQSLGKRDLDSLIKEVAREIDLGNT